MKFFIGDHSKEVGSPLVANDEITGKRMARPIARITFAQDADIDIWSEAEDVYLLAQGCLDFLVEHSDKVSTTNARSLAYLANMIVDDKTFEVAGDA